MPKIFTTVTTTRQEPIGFVCDRCLETISKNSFRTDNFEINYSFGYGTGNDGTTVSACICDDCLMKIIEKEVPHARIKRF